MFRKLFSTKENILSLYNALKDTNYSIDNTDVEIVTLEDTLFKVRMNDLGFVLNNRLVILIEHQSTPNQNMPLRFLLYIAREYEKLINQGEMYKNKLVKIPSPEFFVVYNGKQNRPKEETLQLSSAFIEPTLNLELIVKTINVNYEDNYEFINKSEVLSGYSYFIYLARKYTTKDDNGKGIAKAIKECIDNGILYDFLKSNGSEVFNMVKNEFDMDLYVEVQVEEAKEEARAEGLAEGLAEGRAEGMEQQIEESIIRALSKNLDINLIADINGVSIEKVLEIKNNLQKKCNSLEKMSF